MPPKIDSESSRKRAYLVLGPEASGTRVVTQILISGGCEGTPEHVQFFDNEPPKDQKRIVWRRSYPHGRNRWPLLAALIDPLRARNYDIFAVVCIRDMYANMKAQVVNQKHQPTLERASISIQRAYSLIWKHIETFGLVYWLAPYEALVHRPEDGQRRFLEMIGLKQKNPVKLYNANDKHYEEEE